MMLLDRPDRYGLISRLLHWSMALLLGWQYLSMIARLVLGRGPITAVMVGSHAHVGTVLLVLVLIRGAWGLYNRPRRPPHEASLIGRAAVLGHMALYGLMIVIPTLSLLRQYGSGDPFSPLGLPLMPGLAAPIPELVALGDAVHGELAWLLSILIIGHIAMVGVHHVIWRDNTLERMTPRRKMRRV